MSKIKVVGFDPSTTNWGMAFGEVDLDTLDLQIVNLKLVKTAPETSKGVRKDSDDLRRAHELYGEMILAVTSAALVASEIPFCNPGGYASANYNSGLVVGVLASSPKPVIQVFPQEVKAVITGSRHAAKEEIIQWATEKWPAAPWLTRTLRGKQVLTKDNEHLADACASLYAALRSDQFKQIRSMYQSMQTMAA
ncbi:hypothetical protein [Achromobacter sp. AGC39]